MRGGGLVIINVPFHYQVATICSTKAEKQMLQTIGVQLQGMTENEAISNQKKRQEEEWQAASEASTAAPCCLHNT